MYPTVEARSYVYSQERSNWNDIYNMYDVCKHLSVFFSVGSQLNLNRCQILLFF
jgi:hypothetical protein